MSELLKRRDAANKLNVSLDKLKDLTKKGELASTKIGERTMYLLSEIEHFIQKNTSKAEVKADGQK